MKIGVFDSGLGGMVISKAFISGMPEYDYMYYGDSEHLPYGDKTSGQILNYTLAAMRYMIDADCKIIIIACNTATSICLRYIQQRFIPQVAPDVKVLGVVIPTVEEALEGNSRVVGVIATNATIRSHIYQTELLKIKSDLQITEIAAPQLVPAIETNNLALAEQLAAEYSTHFSQCDSLILGCTHYPLLKNVFRSCLPKVRIISQDEFMADKLKDYLQRHPEIDAHLVRNSNREFFVSSLNEHTVITAQRLFPDIKLLKA